MYAVNKINDAMNQLSQEYKDILVLIVVKAVSYKDAAAYLGKDVADVRVLLNEAREALDLILNTPIPSQKSKFYFGQSTGFVPFMDQQAA